MTAASVEPGEPGASGAAGSLAMHLGRAADGLARQAQGAMLGAEAKLFGTAVQARPVLLAGRYRLEAVVGGGAQGSVWRAHDQRLDRSVAVKFGHPRSDVEALEAGARAEARALALVQHPNVVEVFGVGTWRDGPLPGVCEGDQTVAFVVMEWVDGVSLEQELARGPMPVARVLSVARQVAAGLGAAHHRGVLHRDIKPANILVGRDDRVRVADFGLALLRAQSTTGPISVMDLGSGEPADDGVTSHAVVGTPSYMPPEQLDGRTIDDRADQYALAVTVYQCLHGRVPHPARSLGAMWRAKQHALVESRHAGLTRAQHRHLVRALSPDPGDRFSSTQRFVDALTRPSRRSRWWVGGALGVAAVGALGWAAARQPPTDAECPAPPAALGEDVGASVRVALFDGTATSSTMALRAAAGIERYAEVLSEHRAAACRAPSTGHRELACLDRAAIALVETAGVLQTPAPGLALRATTMVAALADPELCFSDRAAGDAGEGAVSAQAHAVWRALERTVSLQRAGDRRGAVEAAEAAVEVAASVPTLEAEAELALVDALLAHGQLSRARTLAATVWERSDGDGERDLDAARAASRLGWIAGMSDQDAGAAVRWLEHARAAASRGGAPPEVLARIEANTAAVRAMSGDHEAAVTSFAAALAKTNDARGPDHPATWSARENYGVALTLVGRWTDAAAQLEQVVAMRERALGRHPSVASALATLGYALSESREYTRARAVLVRATELGLATRPDARAANALPLSTLAEVERELGNPAAAVEAIAHAVRLRTESLGPDNASTIRTETMWIEHLVAAGQIDRAREVVDTLARRGPVVNSEPDVLAPWLHARAVTAQAEGSPSATTLFDAAVTAQAGASYRFPRAMLTYRLDARDAALRAGRTMAAAQHEAAAVGLAQDLVLHPDIRARLRR